MGFRVVRWSDLQGNKFRKGINFDMAFKPDGYSREVMANQAAVKGEGKSRRSREILVDREFVRHVHYDREYVLQSIVRSVIKPIAETAPEKLSFEVYQDLLKDAYDYHYSNGEFYKGEHVEVYAWRVTCEKYPNRTGGCGTYEHWFEANPHEYRGSTETLEVEEFYRETLAEIRAKVRHSTQSS